ncbi:hypothetical protein [Citrobacter amalonaticus]|uniref:hypothetical protein n=1 Tax=Citrobacter amalonaticus TaxID=35703 RepID=UPI00300D0440
MNATLSTDVTFELYKTHFDYTNDALVLSYVSVPPDGSKEKFLCQVTSDASVYFTLRKTGSSESISLKPFSNLDTAWESPLMEPGQQYELNAFCTDNVSKFVTVHIESVYVHLAG